jgi:hypothetical protein
MIWLILAAALTMPGTVTSALAVDPVASNLSAAQRPGTNLVGI